MARRRRTRTKRWPLSAKIAVAAGVALMAVFHDAPLISYLWDGLAWLGRWLWETVTVDASGR